MAQSTVAAIDSQETTVSASTVPASAEPMSMDAIRALTYAGVEVDGITRRLVELSELEDGWFNGEGLAPDEEGLSWFNVRYHRMYMGRGLPELHIYPSISGGLECELPIGRFECSLSVDLKRHRAMWWDADTETEEGVEDITLDLDDPNDWAWLTDRIATLAGRAECPA